MSDTDGYRYWRMKYIQYHTAGIFAIFRVLTARMAIQRLRPRSYYRIIQQLLYSDLQRS
jgi:hypothetical protein